MVNIDSTLKTMMKIKGIREKNLLEKFFSPNKQNRMSKIAQVKAE